MTTGGSGFSLHPSELREGSGHLRDFGDMLDRHAHSMHGTLGRVHSNAGRDRSGVGSVVSSLVSSAGDLLSTVAREAPRVVRGHGDRLHLSADAHAHNETNTRHNFEGIHDDPDAPRVPPARPNSPVNPGGPEAWGGVAPPRPHSAPPMYHDSGPDGPPLGSSRPPGAMPPGINPNIPPGAHSHVINGDQRPPMPGRGRRPRPRPAAATGGHVLGNDIRPPHDTPGNNPHGLPYGTGVNGPPPPGAVTHPNGVYEFPNANVGYPGGGTMQKPFSTMFPPGVPSTHVADIGQQSVHNGMAGGGFTPGNNAWSGTGTVPKYNLPVQSNDPDQRLNNYSGQQINIEGYVNGGNIATYYPSAVQ